MIESFELSIGDSEVERALGPSKYAYVEYHVDGLDSVEIDMVGEEPDVVMCWVVYQLFRVCCAPSGAKARIDLPVKQGLRKLVLKLDRIVTDGPFVVSVRVKISAERVEKIVPVVS